MNGTDDLAGDLEAALGDALGDDVAAPPETPPGTEDFAPKSLTEDLEQAAEVQDAAQADLKAADDAERRWLREQRRLADAALRGSGIDPEKRAELGISRREATRRLYAAEKLLRENPAEGLSWLAQQYGRSLDDGGRAAAARKLLATFGFKDLGGLTETERSRLQHFEQRARQQQTEAVQGHRWAVGQVEAFSKRAPHFEAVRPLMASLIQAGEAAGLEDAYQRAVSIRGLETDAARKAAEERRAAVAKAKNAGTPRTASVQAPPPDLSNMGLNELLEHQLAQMAD